jgi:Family of unknown function (DUF7010)
MLIADAQRDVRFTYLGGIAGQLVSGILWFVSAALGTWGSPKQAILTLVLGGFFIFPLTVLALRATGHRAQLQQANPMGQLAMQVAFTLPLSLPVVGAATLYQLDWFYPSFMIILGAHYLPFTFLYGMRMFTALCALLTGSGFALGMWGPDSFPVGGWLTGAVLVLFGLAGWLTIDRERKSMPADPG